jgi:hypothetical protein
VPEWRALQTSAEQRDPHWAAQHEEARRAFEPLTFDMGEPRVDLAKAGALA